MCKVSIKYWPLTFKSSNKQKLFIELEVLELEAIWRDGSTHRDYEEPYKSHSEADCLPRGSLLF